MKRREKPERSPENFELEGADIEIFKLVSNAWDQRVALQNKCVEMSIQVTSGLGAVIAGGAIAKINDFPNFETVFEKFRLPLVIGLFFYVIIQLLLLSNYIYHTYRAHDSEQVYHEAISRCFCKFYVPTDSPDSKKKPTKRAWLIKRFQPLVLYVSVALGLLLASLIFFFAQPPIFPGCWIPIIIVLLLWLILLMCVHLRVETLAEESLDSRLRDFLKETNVRENDQPSN